MLRSGTGGRFMATMQRPAPIDMRPLARGDLDALSRIHTDACTIAYAFMGWDHSLAEVREWYDDKVGAWDWALVAEQHGEVVGYVAMAGAHIDQFFVAPVRQGQGVGRQLFAAALARGIRPLTLDVFEENHAARAFYARRGFVEQHRWFNEHDRAVQLRYTLK
jgi:putative acetyltransferase